MKKWKNETKTNFVSLVDLLYGLYLVTKSRSLKCKKGLLLKQASCIEIYHGGIWLTSTIYDAINMKLW